MNGRNGRGEWFCTGTDEYNDMCERIDEKTFMNERTVGKNVESTLLMNGRNDEQWNFIFTHEVFCQEGVDFSLLRPITEISRPNRVPG